MSRVASSANNRASGSRQKVPDPMSSSHGQGISTFPQAPSTTHRESGMPAISQVSVQADRGQVRNDGHNEGTQQFPSFEWIDKNEEYPAKNTNQRGGTESRYVADRNLNEGRKAEPRTGGDRTNTGGTEGISNFVKPIGHRTYNEQKQPNQYTSGPQHSWPQPYAADSKPPTRSAENKRGGNVGEIQPSSFPVGPSTIEPPKPTVGMRPAIQQAPAQVRKEEQTRSGGFNPGFQQFPSIRSFDNDRHQPEVGLEHPSSRGGHTESKYVSSRNLNERGEVPPRTGVETAAVAKSTAHPKAESRKEPNLHASGSQVSQRQKSTDSSGGYFTADESTEYERGDDGAFRSASIPAGRSMPTPEKATKSRAGVGGIEQTTAQTRLGGRAGSGGSSGRIQRLPSTSGDNNDLATTMNREGIRHAADGRSSKGGETQPRIGVEEMAVTTSDATKSVAHQRRGSNAYISQHTQPPTSTGVRKGPLPEAESTSSSETSKLGGQHTRQTSTDIHRRPLNELNESRRRPKDDVIRSPSVSAGGLATTSGREASGTMVAVGTPAMKPATGQARKEERAGSVANPAPQERKGSRSDIPSIQQAEAQTSTSVHPAYFSGTGSTILTESNKLGGQQAQPQASTDILGGSSSAPESAKYKQGANGGVIRPPSNSAGRSTIMPEREVSKTVATMGNRPAVQGIPVPVEGNQVRSGGFDGGLRDFLRVDNDRPLADDSLGDTSPPVTADQWTEEPETQAETNSISRHSTQEDFDLDASSSTEDLPGSSGAKGLLRKIQGFMPLMMGGSSIDSEPRGDKSTKQRKFSGWMKSIGHLKAERTDVDRITPDDVVIGVMGPTGSGKSTFISFVSSFDVGIGHTLKSHTAEVSMVRFSSPALTDSDIVLVDTPGFDDTNKSDVEILTMISDWLGKAHKERILLAGLLYFHRISDNRMAGTPLKNLKMFQELCGKGMLKNVILVTTMWDEVDDKTGHAREEQLREKYWKGLLIQGSKTRRYLRDARSAFLILEPLVEAANTRNAEILKAEMAEIEKSKQALAVKTSSLKKSLLSRALGRQESFSSVRGGGEALDLDRGLGTEMAESPEGTNDRRGRGKGARPKGASKGQMRIQKEMHDYDLELQATSAGQALYEQLGSLVARREEFLKRMREQMSQLDNNERDADRGKALLKELEDLNQNLADTYKEMARLKLTLGDRLTKIMRTTISLKQFTG